MEWKRPCTFSRKGIKKNCISNEYEYKYVARIRDYQIYKLLVLSTKVREEKKKCDVRSERQREDQDRRAEHSKILLNIERWRQEGEKVNVWNEFYVFTTMLYVMW